MFTRTTRRNRRRRNVAMTTHDQNELIGCIFLGALIAGMIAGPAAYILMHL